MSSEPKLNKSSLIESITKESIQYGTKSRFGYFSIPYSYAIGDEAFSISSSYPVRDEHGKVCLPPRNMIMKAQKKGKAADVLFSNPYKIEDNQLERLMKINNEEEKRYLNTVRDRYINKGKAGYTTAFKPSGPVRKKDYFAINPYKEKGLLYSTKPKKYHIDKETRKVIIENKNMSVAYPKKGTSSYPGIGFSYPKDVPVKIINKNKSNEKTERNNDKTYHQPFKPANIMLNSTFYSDRLTYENNNLLKKRPMSCKVNGRKNDLFNQPNSNMHMRPFRPASNMKKGEKGYFSTRYGIPFSGCEKKKIVEKRFDEEEKKEGYRQVFK